MPLLSFSYSSFFPSLAELHYPIHLANTALTCLALPFPSGSPDQRDATLAHGAHCTRWSAAARFHLAIATSFSDCFLLILIWTAAAHHARGSARSGWY